MKVVILAGGYGTRIRDVADDIPKADDSNWPVSYSLAHYEIICPLWSIQNSLFA